MTLEELIDSEPANAARTDQEVFDWLHEPVSVWVDVEWLDFYKWRHLEGVTDALLQIAIDSGNAQRATAAEYMKAIVLAGQPFSSSDPAVRQLILDASLPAGMQSSLQALAQEDRPRWQASAVRSARLGEVIRVRAA